MAKFYVYRKNTTTILLCFTYLRSHNGTRTREVKPLYLKFPISIRLLRSKQIVHDTFPYTTLQNTPHMESSRGHTKSIKISFFILKWILLYEYVKSLQITVEWGIYIIYYEDDMVCCRQIFHSFFLFITLHFYTYGFFLESSKWILQEWIREANVVVKKHLNFEGS